MDGADLGIAVPTQMTCFGNFGACGSEPLTDKLEQLACLHGMGQRADDSAFGHRTDIL